MHLIDILGRILISTLFLVEGIKKIFNPDMTMMYMSNHHVPELLFYPSIAFELIFPILLIVGFKTRIVASILALFVITVTLIFHGHHIFAESHQLSIFLKNLAILGGLLIIIANKSQICSVDYYLENKKNN